MGVAEKLERAKQERLEAEQRASERRKRSRVILWIFIPVLAMAFVFLFLLLRGKDGVKQAEYETLVGTVSKDILPPEDVSFGENDVNHLDWRPDFDALAGQYPDITAWIVTPESSLPVMREPSEQNDTYRGGDTAFEPYAPEDLDSDAHRLVFLPEAPEWVLDETKSSSSFVWLYDRDGVECWKVCAAGTAAASDMIYQTPFVISTLEYGSLLDRTEELSVYGWLESVSSSQRTLYLSSDGTSRTFAACKLLFRYEYDTGEYAE